MLFENLRALRTERKISQKELADAIGLDYKRYNHYETGRSEPDTFTLVTIADYFNVSVDYLLGRDEQQKKPTVENDGLDEVSEKHRLLFAYLETLPDEKLDEIIRILIPRKDDK